MPSAPQTENTFLGIDIGTSGIRASLIDAAGQELLNHRLPFEEANTTKTQQDPQHWWQRLDQLLRELAQKRQQQQFPAPVAMALDGTSGSILACRRDGTPLSPALMYNDNRASLQADAVSRFAPANSAVHGVSSSLAKALWLLEHYPQSEIFCHQADWLGGKLTGRFGISDENNCLKLGYDSIGQCWPAWLPENTPLHTGMLPEVVAPGTALSPVKSELIEKYRLANDCILVAGTTDSNAATLAAVAGCDIEDGLAVTSLGSTLVLKLFSHQPVFSARDGIYSHRLLGHWLVGGASNSGGAVLLQYFTSAQMDAMTPQLKPDRPLKLGYYPLPATGERFPVNDPEKPNLTTPRPASDTEFFQALLEGMADIEAEGYRKLQALGASQLKKVFTAGGGSRNQAWTVMRAGCLGVPVERARFSEASYGAALLARRGRAVNNE